MRRSGFRWSLGRCASRRRLGLEPNAAWPRRTRRLRQYHGTPNRNALLRPHLLRRMPHEQRPEWKSLHPRRDPPAIPSPGGSQRSTACCRCTVNEFAARTRVTARRPTIYTRSTRPVRIPGSGRTQSLLPWMRTPMTGARRSTYGSCSVPTRRVHRNSSRSWPARTPSWLTMAADLGYPLAQAMIASRLLDGSRGREEFSRHRVHALRRRSRTHTEIDHDYPVMADARRRKASSAAPTLVSVGLLEWSRLRARECAGAEFRLQSAGRQAL